MFSLFSPVWYLFSAEATVQGRLEAKNFFHREQVTSSSWWSEDLDRVARRPNLTWSQEQLQ